MIKFTKKGNSVVFDVRVIPRASKSEIVGEHDEALKVKLSSPPVDGAANKELVKLLSKAFGVAKREVTIVRGHTSKRKTVEVFNVNTKTIDAYAKK